MTLAVKGLCCERNKKLLFHELTFQVYSGEALHIIGPNGSGKTSLLQILSGLLLPLTGDILWNNVSIYNSLLFKKKLIYISHKLGMKGILTPYENLYLYLIRRGWIDKNQSLKQIKYTAQKKIYHILEKLNLKAYIKSLTNSLSIGQQRRLALAKLLLLKDTDCWILDEPFNALDCEGIKFFTSSLQEHLKRGGIVILTSHQKLYLSKIYSKRLFLGNHNY